MGVDLSKRRARDLALACGGAAVFGLSLASSALALESVTFETPGAPPELAKDLRAASVVLQSQRDGATTAQDLFSAARAEYARLIGTLYANAYYSPIITVRIDGREAASIAPLDAPARVNRIAITVTAGPKFDFSQARIAPLAPNTTIPKGFAPGKPAETGVIVDAADAAVTGWRDVGYAKAKVGDQSLTVDHRKETLAADIRMAPGPQLRFGKFSVSGQQRMREERIRAIAGFPEGQVFSPDALNKSADRLRRAGVFRSVSLTESDTIGPGNTLDVDTVLVEDKLRRFGFGAEVSNSSGLDLTGYWLQRNLFGGAERLRFDFQVDNVGAQETGEDYMIGVTLERPATFTPDTLASLYANASRINDEDQTINLFVAGFGATQFWSDDLTLRAGLEYRAERVSDITGDYDFDVLAAPLGATYDRRNSKFDPTNGYFVNGVLSPFVGFGETDSGGRLTVDARAYKGFGPENRVVLAGRVQIGSILGAAIENTPRDYLFYSGGAGTVRGQPYQSLGVYAIAPDLQTGGSQFLGASIELRTMITEKIGIVGFYDFGSVGVTQLLNDPEGGEQAGAGIGLRYATSIGPIRFDVGYPVSGDTGDGVQFYLGIGQAF